MWSSTTRRRGAQTASDPREISIQQTGSSSLVSKTFGEKTFRHTYHSFTPASPSSQQQRHNNRRNDDERQNDQSAAADVALSYSRISGSRCSDYVRTRTSRREEREEGSERMVRVFTGFDIKSRYPLHQQFIVVCVRVSVSLSPFSVCLLLSQSSLTGNCWSILLSSLLLLMSDAWPAFSPFADFLFSSHPSLPFRDSILSSSSVIRRADTRNTYAATFLKCKHIHIHIQLETGRRKRRGNERVSSHILRSSQPPLIISIHANPFFITHSTKAHSFFSSPISCYTNIRYLLLTILFYIYASRTK